MTVVEAGPRGTELNVEAPVVLGLPAELAAAFTAEATAAVEAEIDELAAGLALPVRAHVTVAPNPASAFTVDVHGRSCPGSVEHLVLAYRASTGWAETPPDRDPIGWLADGLRNRSDVVTTWFRMWARATLNAGPALLMTDPVLAWYRDHFRQHPGTAARRLAESAEAMALLLRTVVDRGVAVPVDKVLEMLESADDGDDWVGDPAVLAEWLVYRLRPDLVQVRLAPDVPSWLVPGIAAAGTNPFKEVQEEFAETWGLPAPQIRVTVDEAVPPGRFDVTVNALRTVALPPPPAGTRSVASPAEGQAGRPVGNPFTRGQNFLVDAGTDDVPGADAFDAVRDWLRRCLWRSAPCFVEKWTMEQRLRQLDGWYPVLNGAMHDWAELGPAAFGLARLTHQLVLEGQPVTDLRSLLEHILDRMVGGVAADPVTSARHALSRSIGARVLAESTRRPVVRLGRAVEAGLVEAAAGWTPMLPPADDRTGALVAEVRQALGEWSASTPDPVVLCDCDPAVVARALRAEHPGAVVSRVDDLPPTVRRRVPERGDTTSVVTLGR